MKRCDFCRGAHKTEHHELVRRIKQPPVIPYERFLQARRYAMFECPNGKKLPNCFGEKCRLYERCVASNEAKRLLEEIKKCKVLVSSPLSRTFRIR